MLFVETLWPPVEQRAWANKGGLSLERGAAVGLRLSSSSILANRGAVGEEQQGPQYPDMSALLAFGLLGLTFLAGERGNSMTDPAPTAYPAINAALRDFLASIRAILGSQLRGMYLVGSLAVGDFDLNSSDLDIIVVTDGALSDGRIAALREWHTRFGASDSPWAMRLEAVYIPENDLRSPASATTTYPQVERDRPFFVEPVEPGWSVQRYTLREHGVVIAGPNPRDLLDQVDPDEMRRDGAIIARTWLDQAEHDPTWLDWARPQPYFAFVIATLCRLLYTLETGGVASKPAAIRWAQQTLDGQWAGFVDHSWEARHKNGETPQEDIEILVAFIRYTVERYDAVGFRSAQ
jgi:hypothetical protein